MPFFKKKKKPFWVMQRFDPKKKVMQKTKNMQNRTNREKKKNIHVYCF